MNQFSLSKGEVYPNEGVEGEGRHMSAKKEASVPMLLWCPECGVRHIDVGDFAIKLHHTHACQHCGHCWRPAIVPTCGVRFLPGFRNGQDS